MGACGTSPAAGAATADESLAYLYIEANEGESAGGHAALRVGERVYHYQHMRGGLLRLRRSDAADFRLAYRVFGNRPLHVGEIATSHETRTLVRRAFEHELRVESAHFDRLEDLARDRWLLEREGLGARRTDEHPKGGRSREGSGPPVEALPVRGAGIFAADPRGEEPVLVALRERVLAEYGADHLERREREIRAWLAQATPSPYPAATLVVDARRHPAFLYPFFERVHDREAALAALDVLREARPLDPEIGREHDDPGFRLDEQQRRAVCAWREQLEDGLVDLAASSRPDWGTTLLVGMARRIALERSCRSGRLVVVDSYPDDAPRVDVGFLRQRPESFRILVRRARWNLSHALASLQAEADSPEIGWTAVEDQANRLAEILDAPRRGWVVRIESGVMVPSRAGPRPLPDLPALGTTALGNARNDAARRERSYEQAMKRAYGYDLVRRNCVTAIFESIEEALDGQDADTPASEESTQRLGGYVEPGADLTFIPFVSWRAVRSRYAVSGVSRIPSFREQRLAEMRDHESALWVALRESNVLTSTVYEPNDRDSFFLFFTNGPAYVRPPLGLVNLAAGLGEALWGLVRAPFDRGRTLRRGLTGMAMSVPELAFVNIRKGSFEDATPVLNVDADPEYAGRP